MSILLVSAKDYYLEINSDDDMHYIRIASFDNFDDATAAFRALIDDEPDMRVTMRRRAHVFDHYVPVRLRGPGDRRG